MPGSAINTILDLDGKRVAVLRGDINAAAFRDNAEKFNINPTYVEYDTLGEVFEGTAAGNADAAVAFHVAGQEAAKTYRLAATPVMFYPNSLGFAVPKGKNPDLLLAIDRYLVREKSNPSSFYSETMQKWFGERAGWVMPPYILWGLALTSGLVILLVCISVLFRKEVRRKTAELSRQNLELQSEVARRTQVEAELVRKNDELQAAYEQLSSTEAELRAKYGEIGKSEQALRQARKKLSLLSTLTSQEIQNGVFSLSGYIALAKETGCSTATTSFLERGETILRSIEGSLRFAKNYQDMGISQPQWHKVKLVCINAAAYLDFSLISRAINLDDLEIYADPLLSNVFLNLMENVIRHAKGATRITLRYEKTDEGVTILVEDDGPGIPVADKETIFERGATGKGGSGLFLAREILSITGIAIRETGSEGTGARFEILVPDGEYRFATKDPAPQP